MNTENSRANELHRLKLTLTGKLNLKGPNKNMQHLKMYPDLLRKNGLKFMINQVVLKIDINQANK